MYRYDGNYVGYTRGTRQAQESILGSYHRFLIVHIIIGTSNRYTVMRTKSHLCARRIRVLGTSLC